ncbi:ParA family protein, partial [Enterococcus hirae]
VEYSENKELYNKHKNFFNQTWKVYDTILNKLNGSDQ